MSADDVLTQKQIDELLNSIQISDDNKISTYEYCSKCQKPTKRVYLHTGRWGIIKIINTSNEEIFSGNFSHQTIICVVCGHKYYVYPKEPQTRPSLPYPNSGNVASVT